jgi:hypothetical protein
MQLYVGFKVLPTDKCCRFLDNQIFFIQDVPVRAGKRKASVTFLEVGQPYQHTLAHYKHFSHTSIANWMDEACRQFGVGSFSCTLDLGAPKVMMIVFF